MNKNGIMFIVGSVIFVTYIYFYFKIIIGEHKDERQGFQSYDTNDFDGIGNQGRIPDKKPKNRAF